MATPPLPSPSLASRPRLRGPLLDDFVVLRRRALCADDAELIAPPSSVIGLLDAWLAEHSSRRALLALYEELASARSGPRGWSEQDLGRVIAPRLSAAFRAGELVALRARRELPATLAGERAEPAAQPPPPPPPEEVVDTWVEIQLLNQDGEPVGGEHYLLVLPSGEKREGVLDHRGRARVDGIDPGTCKVSFPKLKGEPSPVL